MAEGGLVPSLAGQAELAAGSQARGRAEGRGVGGMGWFLNQTLGDK